MNYTICKKCFAALLAAGAIVSSMPFVGATDETTIPDQTGEQKLPAVEMSVPFDEPNEGEEALGENVTPRADIHPFANKMLQISKPNTMTFPKRNITYQPYATIDIIGTCDRAGATLYFELYQYVNGDPVRISYSSVKVASGGVFEWSSSYGASGDYAIKVWADDFCSISGNLIY